MEALKIIVWPLACLLMVIFIVLLLKSSLVELLASLKKFKYGNFDAEIIRGQTDHPVLPDPGSPTKSNVVNNVDKSLGLYSEATLELVTNAIAQETNLSQITDGEAKLQTMFKYSQALYLILEFERTYSAIFGSQLYLLEYLNVNPGETREALQYYYNEAKEKHPTFYDKYTYDQYFEFLLYKGLLIGNEDSYSITWLGRDFLKFLTHTGRTLNKGY